MKNLKELTDEQLAMNYIEGDNRAFDELLSRTQSKLYSYIMFVVHDRETAGDVFQETFVKVITRLHQRKYAPSGKFGAWLMRIAHNVMMDLYRNHRSDKVVEAANNNDLSNMGSEVLLDTPVESQFVNSQILRDVEKMMNNLPAPQREVVYMRFYQEKSFKEIAETTGVSINTSLGRMRYAVLNLRRMAKEHNIQLQLA